jgi:hypothetical protein
MEDASGNELHAWALAVSDLIADAWDIGVPAPNFVYEARSAAWTAAGMPEIEETLQAWEQQAQPTGERITVEEVASSEEVDDGAIGEGYEAGDEGRVG